MAHLHLKRFADSDDLTPGARRNRAQNPYEVIADMAPTGRASCKQCGTLIPKDSVRFVLMLQCHKGAFEFFCTSSSSSVIVQLLTAQLLLRNLGYRMAAPVHGRDPNCFVVHVETEKLTRRDEVLVKESALGKENTAYVWCQVDAMIARNSEVKSEQATVVSVAKPEKELVASVAPCETAGKQESCIFEDDALER